MTAVRRPPYRRKCATLKVMRLPAAFVFLCAAFIPAAHAQEDTVSRYTVVDGISIHYYEHGSAVSPGRTLLILHGWCGNVEYLPMMRAMPDDVRVIDVDWPGCGLSDKPDIHYSTESMVDFLLEFCGSMGLKTFVLVGHSMGGMISIHFSVAHPEMVEKLFLIAPTGLKGEEGGLLLFSRIGPLVDFGLSLGQGMILDIAMRVMAFYAAEAITPEYFDAVSRTLQDPESRRALVRITGEIIGSDPVDDLLPALRMPVRILWGREDRVLDQSWGEKYASAIPNAELKIMPQCGHMMMMEYPEKLAAELSDFMENG
jgi:pimeloyl-ACP methyl ester carboxylesterase